MRPETDRALALAGVVQGALLTQQIARRGVVDTAPMEASLHSLFQIDAESVPAVFGGTAGVTQGLRELTRQLGQPSGRNLEVARYALGLIQLERRLAADSERMAAIGRGLEALRPAFQRLGPAGPEVIEGLAELYKENISSLTPRIMVQGDPTHLRNPETGARIRAFLLAGIRAALLWRQCGGRRRDLLLRRGRLIAAARELLSAG
jgi:high frequency lysogenization protein